MNDDSDSDGRIDIDMSDDENSELRPVSAGRIDFKAAKLPEYKNCYAIVLDSLYSRDEAVAILDAPAKAGQNWDIARVNAGTYEFTDTTYRNGERIIHDSFELSERIFERIRPHLKEIEEIEEDVVVRMKDRKDGSYKRVRAKQKWRMVRMNERLRFLRYPVGGFFRQHIDGCYYDEQTEQQTFYTVQVYLPSDTTGSDESFKSAGGGSTRFWGQGVDDYADVEALPGRVLVFQHEDLLHTGQEVTSGVKCAMRSDILYEKVGAPVPT
ncbi:P4Hc domain-containing protein [Mycena chlorophos]|uniref:P4Hc domain-containing protein n=1 Tax=Mycena chlorophos TaxID=658473 RepID=A0A8H6W2H5_MYCCL|nr:P4Hc domain-containing protein [Mycena chlorophos]